MLRWHSAVEADKLTLRCPFRATVHGTHNLKDSVKSPKYSSSSVSVSTRQFTFCNNVCMFLFVVISVLLFTDVLSRIVFWFVIHSVVDMLGEHTAHHLRRQVFLHQTSLLCSSSPVPTLPQGHSVCRREALDVFCGELRYSVVPDLAFSSFIGRSCHSTLKPDSHVRIWWEPQNAEKSDIFLSSSQTPKLQTSFSSLATLLSFLSTNSSLSLPLTHSL